MQRILTTGIDLAAAAIVFLPILCLAHFLFHPRSFRRTALCALFMLYLCAVFSLVGIPSIHSLTFDPSLNLLPLVDGLHDPVHYLKNSLLNLLLFIPLGMLLPGFLGENCTWKKVFLWGVCLSLAVECLQLFTFRLTDVDDLLMNSAGAVLGYCLTKIVRPGTSMRTAPRPWVLLALLAAAFLVMFLVQPLLSGAIWEILLETPLWEHLH